MNPKWGDGVASSDQRDFKKLEVEVLEDFFLPLA